MIWEEVKDVVEGAQDLKEAFEKLANALKKKEDVPNPLFVANGIEGESPKTKKVMKFRKYKKWASKVFSFAGSAGAAGTAGVNVADTLKHGASVGSTGVHLYRLHAMAEKVRDGGSLMQYLRLIMALKAAKLGARGVSLAAAAIPVPALGVVSGVGEKAQGRFVKSQKEAILRTAWALHWRAYRELVLLRGSTTGSGPALRIVRELVTLSATNAHKKLGFLDFGNLHSVSLLNECMMEPLGYEIIAFKLEQA